MLRRIISVGWRQVALLGTMLLVALLITRNLVYWQVTKHTALANAATRVYDAVDYIPAPRGEILDANQTALVTSATVYQLAVDPTSLAPGVSRATAATKIAAALHLDAAGTAALVRTLTQATSQYVPVARGLDDATATALRNLRLGIGIILTPSTRAYYPLGSLAAPVLGFVNAQGQGQYGLEQSYDTLLRGSDGVKLKVDNTTTRPLPAGVPKERPAVPGATLVLTIDANIQQMVEKRLAEAVKRDGARGGSAVIMDPKTGAVLAMASYPSFDPNNYGAYAPDLYNDRALTNYPPGSTFKVMSVATGLDTNSFTTNTTINDPGYFYADPSATQVIHNWAPIGWGAETPETMLRHSANVGMVQFALMIHPVTKFYDYIINHFGFTRPTGIDVPEQEFGNVRVPGRDPWQPIDLMDNSFGQSIDVTPLQLTTAMASLANGGKRMRPYLVQKIVYPDGRIKETQPHVVTQAVKPSTAATMTDLLHRSGYSSTLNETSSTGSSETTCALTPGFPVAAKTGTATVDVSAYAVDKSSGFIASLLGYAPINDPKFVMLITIDHPQPGPDGQHIYGSMAAGPAWHDIAEGLYRYMHIQPSQDPYPPFATENIPLYQGPHGWNCDFDQPIKP